MVCFDYGIMIIDLLVLSSSIFNRLYDAFRSSIFNRLLMHTVQGEKGKWLLKASFNLKRHIYNQTPH
jgi:hypothetical protein